MESLLPTPLENTSAVDGRTYSAAKARAQKVENARQRAAGETNINTISDSPRLFVNSLLADADVTNEMRERPDKFHNSRDPNLAILEEKSQHLIVIILKAQGKTQSAIAKLTGFSEPWVSQILRQPWAKKRLLDELRAAGQDAIMGVLKAEALESVERVIEIRDDPSAPKAVRLNAANSLLDRHLGKATQHVETVHSTTPSFDDIEALNARLDQLRAAESQLTLTRKN